MNSNLTVFTELNSTYSHLHKKLDRYLGAVHGLGVSEFRVLSELDKTPGGMLSRIELAERLSLTASGITRLLNPMQKIGLIQKLANERDARISLVALGDSGQTRAREAADGVDHVMEASLKKLRPDEVNTLLSLLEKLS